MKKWWQFWKSEQKKVEEFGDRLHELEKTVWKSSAITGLITGLVIFILEKLVG